MSEDPNEQSPFTRPGFILSAILVGALVVVAFTLLVVNRHQGAPVAAAPPAATPLVGGAVPTVDMPAASASGRGATADPAVGSCGLGGVVQSSGSVAAAPDVDSWQHVATMAFPTSTTFGPAAADPGGFNTCFEHSATGAVFAAAYMAAASSGASSTQWLSYVLADTPNKAALVTQVAQDSGAPGTRFRLGGFRVIAYDGDMARIDLAVAVSNVTATFDMSVVYDLVWQGGDWKWSLDPTVGLDSAEIPNFAGYILWGE